MTSSYPTKGQLERTLSQKIQALYRTQLGHRLGEVDCQIFDQKIAIVLENSLTQPEQLLAHQGNQELVLELHSNLDEAMRPQLTQLIEEVVGVSVVDFMSDATLETERTGMIAILSTHPSFRDRPNGKSDPQKPTFDEPSI
mgnify:CR=1 FL=1